MQEAIEEGDAMELAELIRQDPGLDVNVDYDGEWHTLLHLACLGYDRSPVIPLLLAHPDIDQCEGLGWMDSLLCCLFPRVHLLCS